jgi:hypothetical protein
VPDFLSKLPARPSLEQLRKQAKERLRTMPGAKLAEAQFALAREHGFESWAKLVHHVEALPAADLEQHERIAKDLVAAYRSADAGAVQRLNDLFHSSSTRRVRHFVGDRLFALPDGERRIADFTLPTRSSSWPASTASRRGRASSKAAPRPPRIRPQARSASAPVRRSTKSTRSGA